MPLLPPMPISGSNYHTLYDQIQAERADARQRMLPPPRPRREDRAPPGDYPYARELSVFAQSRAGVAVEAEWR